MPNWIPCRMGCIQATYMSPERISGLAHTVSSDIWSLGLSMMEAATGRCDIVGGVKWERSDWEAARGRGSTWGSAHSGDGP